jgi:hypothetical protein
MFNIPESHTCTNIHSNDDRNHRVVSNLFREFDREKGQNGRKKIFLLIAGSYLPNDNSEQFYPNYIKDVASNNPDCDFFVLNVDNNSEFLRTDRFLKTSENLTLRFLSGMIQPLRSPKFYERIAEGLQHFDKVIFCSHTEPLGFLNFHSLHKHCQEQDIDCLTIGAYFTSSPSCIIKEPVIEQEFVPMNLYNPQGYNMDSRLLRTCSLSSREKEEISKIGNFFNTIFINQESEELKQVKIAVHKSQDSDTLSHFTGIEDENFIKAISQFVKREKEAEAGLPRSFSGIADRDAVDGLDNISREIFKFQPQYEGEKQINQEPLIAVISNLLELIKDSKLADDLQVGDILVIDENHFLEIKNINGKEQIFIKYGDSHLHKFDGGLERAHQFSYSLTQPNISNNPREIAELTNYFLDISETFEKRIQPAKPLGTPTQRRPDEFLREGDGGYGSTRSSVRGDYYGPRGAS